MWFSYLQQSLASNICSWLVSSCAWGVKKKTYGGSQFNRIPTASNSASSNALCSAFLVASRIIRMRSLVFAALITCLPRPLPSAAPSIIPGKSNIWISAPPYSKTPGIAVNVVKEYAATSDFVLVILDRKVDFPTEGNPTSAIRASPDFWTSNPGPPAEPAPGPGSRSCAR